MNELPFTSGSFDQFCSEKKVMASKCKKCGTLMLPPRPICLKCHGSDMTWQALKGKGKLVSFTVIGVGPTPMIKEGYNKDNPYCSGIVELDEGVRITTQLMGFDASRPETIKIGTELTADFTVRGSHSLVPELADVRKTYLVFRPA